MAVQTVWCVFFDMLRDMRTTSAYRSWAGLLATARNKKKDVWKPAKAGNWTFLICRADLSAYLSPVLITNQQICNLKRKYVGGLISCHGFFDLSKAVKQHLQICRCNSHPVCWHTLEQQAETSAEFLTPCTGSHRLYSGACGNTALLRSFRCMIWWIIHSLCLALPKS